MKKLTGILLLTVLPFFGMAQNKAVQDFFNKYNDHEDVTYVVLKGSLFNLFKDIAEYDNGDEPDEDLQALGHMAGGIKSMKIIQVPYYETNLTKDEVNSLRASLEKDNYEEYVRVKEGKELVNIMAQGDDTEVRNMIILVEEKGEFTIISVDGKLSVKDLSYISKHHADWH